jgi:methionine aminopeptidase
MTYTDAKEYLRIAENAYNIDAYTEAAEIVAKVAQAVAFDTDMPKIQRDEIAQSVKSQIARFQFCPDECCWEVVSELSNLFKDE